MRLLRWWEWALIVGFSPLLAFGVAIAGIAVGASVAMDAIERLWRGTA